MYIYTRSYANCMSLLFTIHNLLHKVQYNTCAYRYIMYIFIEVFQRLPYNCLYNYVCIYV